MKRQKLQIPSHQDSNTMVYLTHLHLITRRVLTDLSSLPLLLIICFSWISHLIWASSFDLWASLFNDLWNSFRKFPTWHLTIESKYHVFATNSDYIFNSEKQRPQPPTVSSPKWYYNRVFNSILHSFKRPVASSSLWHMITQGNLIDLSPLFQSLYYKGIHCSKTMLYGSLVCCSIQ